MLQRPSLDLTKKNNENKTASELVRNEDIKNMFKIFLTEKSLLDAKYNQRVQIHHTKNDQVQKMFGNAGFKVASTSPIAKKNVVDHSDIEIKVNFPISHSFS